MGKVDLRGYVLHSVILTLLYLCQGAVQGTLIIAPLLLQQRSPHFPVSDLATLTVPLGCFSIKFLWAPIVDRCYIKWDGNRLGPRGWGRVAGPRCALHRRAQWVIVLQLLMAALYILTSLGDADALFAAATQTRLGLAELWWLLLLLAVGSATQDVAVDAWAVEGLPAHMSSIPGSMQLTGVVGGIMASTVFMQVNSAYPKACTITAYMVVCGVLCVISAGLALLLTMRRALVMTTGTSSTSGGKTSEGQRRGLRDAMAELTHTQGVREILIIYLTRGWPVAVWNLVLPRLIAMRVIQAADVALYKSIGTVVQLVIGFSFASRVVGQVQPIIVLRNVSGVELAVASVAAMLFVLIASPACAIWYGWTFVFPLVMCLCCSGAFSFIGNMAVASTVARRFPHDAGGVLTLLNAVGNMGYVVPEWICLYAADATVWLISLLTGTDTNYATLSQINAIVHGGNHTIDLTNYTGSLSSTKVLSLSSLAPVDVAVNSRQLRLVKMDVLLCGPALLAWSIFARCKYLLPSVNMIYRLESAASKDEEALDKIL